MLVVKVRAGLCWANNMLNERLAYFIPVGSQPAELKIVNYYSAYEEVGG